MSHKLEYEVLKPGHVDGKWRVAGEMVRLAEAAARYLILSGQLRLKSAPRAKGKK